jgi:hypothetical protein
MSYFGMWKLHTQPRVLKESGEYMLEDNTNYPEGEGNIFLMKAIYSIDRDLPNVRCVGGIEQKSDKSWEASINMPYDEETDSDSRLVYIGDRDTAIEKLWEEKYSA